MFSGQFNFDNGRTFDLFNYPEIQTSVNVTSCHIQLSYIDDKGQLI